MFSPWLLKSILRSINPGSGIQRASDLTREGRRAIPCVFEMSIVLPQISHASAGTLNRAARRLPEAGGGQRLHAWLCLYVH